MTPTTRCRALPALALLLAAACSSGRAPGTVIVRPGAPGTPSRTEAAGTRAASANEYVAADVRFVHGMIVHHAQALEMTELVAARTTREDVRALAQRIELSQSEEIARMQRWLAARNEPTAAAQHMHMPGMLSDDEMAQLRRASGTAFERLFLELMIKHHEGALTMVADLFATEGAGQEPELFRFATEVDAGQRAEIARMRRMLSPPTQRG